MQRVSIVSRNGSVEIKKFYFTHYSGVTFKNSFLLLTSMQKLTAKPHYHFVTNMLIDLFNAGELPNVASLQVEPTYGYVGRIVYCDGSIQIFRGQSLGLNSLGSSEVVKDKAYTKFFLRENGIKTPDWELFLAAAYLEKLSQTLSRHGVKVPQMSSAYAHEKVISGIGYPCYCKPNFGSQGTGIVKCYDKLDLETAIRDIEGKGEAMVLVERAVEMPDFRLVVLGNEVLSCYERKPLSVIGDGVRTIDELLQLKKEQYRGAGRDTKINEKDPRISKRLTRKGLNFGSIPKSGEHIPLLDVSNLSLGGDSEDYSTRLHKRWADLAVSVSALFGLKFSGIDLACENLERGNSDYSLLEVNSAPGLDNYAAAGEEQIERVRRLYKKVFIGMQQDMG